MEKVFKTLLLFVFILIGVTSSGQTDICHENATGIFWPINSFGKLFYQTKNQSYVSYFNGDSLKVGEKVYFKQIEEFGPGDRKENYFREAEGNVYVYDTEKKIEFLELSGNTSPGNSWEKSDKSWKYTVIDTSSSLSTPYCEFKNLLNIRAEPQGELKKKYAAYFNLYYKRGVGLVGLNIEGSGYSFLSIDKSTAVERSQVIAGCEELSSQEQRAKCTSSKVNEFIAKNFNYHGKIKKGKIALRFLITEKGEVENVSLHQSIRNAEGQSDEAMRIVKLLKFIPRTINGKAVKTWVIIPIVF